MKWTPLSLESEIDFCARDQIEMHWAGIPLSKFFLGGGGRCWMCNASFPPIFAPFCVVGSGGGGRDPINAVRCAPIRYAVAPKCRRRIPCFTVLFFSFFFRSEEPSSSWNFCWHFRGEGSSPPGPIILSAPLLPPFFLSNASFPIHRSQFPESFSAVGCFWSGAFFVFFPITKYRNRPHSFSCKKHIFLFSDMTD